MGKEDNDNHEDALARALRRAEQAVGKTDWDRIEKERTTGQKAAREKAARDKAAREQAPRSPAARKQTTREQDIGTELELADDPVPSAAPPSGGSSPDIGFGMVDLGGSDQAEDSSELQLDEKKLSSAMASAAAPPPSPLDQAQEPAKGHGAEPATPAQPAAQPPPASQPQPGPPSQPGAAATDRPAGAAHEGRKPIMLGQAQQAPPRTARPQPPGARQQSTPATSDAAQARRPKIQREEARLPRRNYLKEYARQIKIGSIVLVVLAVITAAVIGIVKWRESVAAKEQAEQNRLDQQSLESLKENTVKKEKYAQ